MRESPKFSQNSALFVGGNMCTNLLGTPNVFLTTHTLGSFPGILAMQGSKALSGSQHSDFTTFAWGIQDGNPAPKTSRGGPSCWVNSRWFNRPLLKVAYFWNKNFCFISPWVDVGGWIYGKNQGGIGTVLKILFWWLLLAYNPYTVYITFWITG